MAVSAGGRNTASGAGALTSNTTGLSNTAYGVNALATNTTGFSNTSNGDGALANNTNGSENTATGAFALLNDQNSVQNTANGAFALFSNTNANGNTATGYQALFHNNGGGNTADGWKALHENTTGSFNIAIGENTLFNNTTGSNNTGVGVDAGSSVTTANNVICIGTAGANVDNSCYVGNIFGAASPGGLAVLVNSDGKLGTSVSSRRFKDDIRPMDKTSEAILALKPVAFRYKKEFDPTGISQFGLVAEDVEKTNPDLVVRDKKGKPYSVRYDQVNAMLLNEFLKENQKVQEQQKEIDSLKAELKEQRDLIQEVSNRVEMIKPAPQVVADNQ